MTEIDYSILRGVADEVHWQEFVIGIGGELIAPLIKKQGVQNADFLFSASKVVAELKIIETDFLNTGEVRQKLGDAFEAYPGADPNDLSGPLGRTILKILRDPLQRIIKKANRQIRQTKQELGLAGWRGVIIMVNDGFRTLPPEMVMRLCSDILSRESYSSADAFIYQTNHYIEVPSNPYAVLLWAPSYGKKADKNLVDFINDLGRKWRKFSEEKDGPYDYSEEHEKLDLSKSIVIKGANRSMV